MAHKKGGGTAQTNRDSISKRLGVKRYGGQIVKGGEIIVRQKGSKFHPGIGVKEASDYTIFSLVSGKVEFKQKLGKKVINVISDG